MAEHTTSNSITEKEFLESYSDAAYEKPSVTTDILVLGVDRSITNLKVLLIKRKEHPYLGYYALPGGFIRKDETAYRAAARKLYDETGLKDVYLNQIYTFTNPERDPRTWVMSIAYLALVGDVDNIETRGEWFNLCIDDERMSLFNEESGVEIIYPISVQNFQNGRIEYANLVASDDVSGEKLAFDHVEIIIESVLKLRTFFENSDMAFNMVPETFTLPDLQALYELILGKKLYKTNFRAMIAPKVEMTGEKIKSCTSNKMSAEYRYIG
ncbi:MAG: NUDIX hydrolase [Butyrivibrio sp.]|nr:NUDIX hydrolase [Butyrivibrio sp.]